MPISKKAGSLLPFLQSVTVDFDPTRGSTEQLDFSGLSIEQMEALEGDYIRDGIACRLTWHKGVTSLETNDSTQNYTLDGWGIEGNSELKDLFDHPLMLSALTDALSFKLQAHLNNGDDNETVFGNGVSGGDPLFIAFYNTAVERIYSLYSRGGTEFWNDAYGAGYVVQHVTNAPSRWNQNIADFSVGKVYSTAELLTELQDSRLWILPLPPRLVYKLANIPAPALIANRMWGWRKSRSTESTAANNRIDIRQYYTLGLHQTDIYTPL